MNTIELTRKGTRPQKVTINTDTVIYFYPSDKGTSIHFLANNSMLVTEPYEEVKKLLGIVQTNADKPDLPDVMVV